VISERTTPEFEERESLSARSRVLGALAYLPFLCFLPYFTAPGDPFARHHGRHGFLLLFLIVVLGLVLRVLEWALDPIPFLGALVTTLARLSFGLTLLGLGVLGSIKGLLGDRWSLASLERLASRVPL
jgi:hypothetical protein